MNNYHRQDLTVVQVFEHVLLVHSAMKGQKHELRLYLEPAGRCFTYKLCSPKRSGSLLLTVLFEAKIIIMCIFKKTKAVNVFQRTNWNMSSIWTVSDKWWILLKKKTSACDLSNCKSYDIEQHHCFGPSSNQSQNHQLFQQVGNVYMTFTVVLGPLIQSTVHPEEEEEEEEGVNNISWQRNKTSTKQKNF